MKFMEISDIYGAEEKYNMEADNLADFFNEVESFIITERPDDVDYALYNSRYEITDNGKTIEIGYGDFVSMGMIPESWFKGYVVGKPMKVDFEDFEKYIIGKFEEV